ncbi:cytochrome b/b6 domain-containing protein [Aquabacterium sp.]|uniref:cytochrome b/b6 domain-containing protein n=2 Tax=Aquabacterium TaxID=92793 RepID=UPI0035C72E57
MNMRMNADTLQEGFDRTDGNASAETIAVPIWDIALRLFHWLLVAAVVAAIATGLAGGAWMVWHGRAGIAIAGLLGFRLSWGLLGSETALFRAFLPTPARLRAYLKGRWHGVGHNPLGALSVLALLILLAVQLGTGLFSHDDIAFSGPLTPLLTDEQIGDLTAWHHRVVNLLYGLLGLHIAAIAFYAVVRRKDLVRPMVTGKASLPTGTRAPHPGKPAALVMSVAIGVAVAWGASGLWITHAPAASPTAQPAPGW